MAGKGAVRICLVMVIAVFLTLPIISFPTEGAYTNNPIVVQGDDGFAAAGFIGNGTWNHPYVLSDVTVNAYQKYHGIMVANTTMHFRIVDCTVTDAFTPDRDRLNTSASGSGIFLNNVTNGVVVNFLGQSNARGVTVANSRNVTISDSQFVDNIAAGVYFIDCVDGKSQVVNCSFNKIEDVVMPCGVLMEDSQGVMVKDNIIEDCVTGIHLTAITGSCSGNLVTSNVVRDHTEHGILLDGNLLTSDNIVQGNTVQGVTSGSGICVGFGTRENITGNQVSRCLYGIISMWDDNTVSGNKLSNNTRGILIGEGADGNLVSDNSVKDGSFGIHISPSQGNQVLDNTILRMDQAESAVGVYLGIGAVRDAVISNNTIADCNFGIRAATTATQGITGISLTDNSVNGSLKQGVSLLYVSDSQILNNSFHANGNSGIYLGAQCHDLLVQGNVVGGNHRYGLEIRDADDNHISGNIFDSNELEGVYIDSGSGNVIYANALLFNKDSGRQYSPLRVQAYCGEEGNDWYLGGGNLWADWLSPDLNDDGIVDQPYTIPDGFQDPFPLTEIADLDIPADLTAPEAVAYCPQGMSVEHDSAINITFSEDMDLGSVNVTVNNETKNGTWSDRTFTVNVTLTFETDYQVRVTGQDLAGNILPEFIWTFRTEGPIATVSGRVLTNDSMAITGANVTCGDITVQTDEEGRFSLLLAPGDRMLIFRMDGYLIENRTVQVLPGEDMDIGDVLLEEEEMADEPGALGPIWLIAITLAVLAALVVGALLWRRRK